MKEPKESRAPEQVAIDELRAEATTPEDLKYLEEVQAALDAERAEVLTHVGGEIVTLSQLPDGSLVTKEDVQAIVANGNPPIELHDK